MDYFDGQSTKFKLMIKFFQASYDCLLFLIVVQRDVVAVAFAVVLGVSCLVLILCVAALIHLSKITPGGIKNGWELNMPIKGISNLLSCNIHVYICHYKVD